MSSELVQTRKFVAVQWLRQLLGVELRAFGPAGPAEVDPYSPFHAALRAPAKRFSAAADLEGLLRTSLALWT